MAWKKSPPDLVAAFEGLVPKKPDIERRSMSGYPAAFDFEPMPGRHERMDRGAGPARRRRWPRPGLDRGCAPLRHRYARNEGEPRETHPAAAKTLTRSARD